jgi:hypothetical protein
LTDQEVSHLLVSREPVALEPFTMQDVVAFMQSRNVQENPPDLTFASALHWSGGAPGLLAGMANKVLAQTSRQDPFFQDL